MRLKIIKCGGVNCYLLSDGGSSVLIDTATFKVQGKIIRSMQKGKRASRGCSHTDIRTIPATPLFSPRS